MPAPALGRQNGFALIGALFVVIGIAGVALIALMTMTLSFSKISVIENAKAREVRAADNALDSAINMMRMDPAGLLGTPDNCIDPAGVDFASNERVVTVTATCEASPQLIRTDAVSSPTAPALQLVGPNGYQSGDSFADTVHWDNECLLGNPALGSCAPWVLGIGSSNYTAHAPTEFAAARPSLIHVADDDPSDLPKTLTVGADLLARRGSATMIPPSGVSPAVRVAGNYQQADLGLFAPQGPIDCGIGTTGHPWNVVAAQIADNDDPLGVPTCGSGATAAAALDERAELGSPPGFGDTFTTFAPTPTCSAGSGGVVQLAPGAYGKAQTAALNQLLGGTCPKRTFWFKPVNASTPGSYWFDVDDPTNPSRDLWNSLIISDPTVRVIFGTPAGGFSASAAGSAVFPAACDATGAGVEIELSERTTIRHLAGQVAVCDRSTSAATNGVPAALWQAGNGDGGWNGVPNAAQSQMSVTWDTSWIAFDSNFFNGAGNAWAVDGNVASAGYSCTFVIYGTCGMDVTTQARNFQMPGGPTAPVGRLNSLDLVMRARAISDVGFSLSFYGSGNVGTRVSFYRPGASSPSCGGYFPYLPDSRNSSYMNLAIDLLSPVAQGIAGLPRCRDVSPPLTRADLAGAGVDVVQRIASSAVTLFTTVNNRIDIDGLELRAGWDLKPTSATGGAGWNNASNILTTDGLHSGYTLSGCPFLGSCATATRSVQINGFDNLTSPHVPVPGGTPLLEAGVIVTGETTNQNFFTNGSFYDLNGEPDISQGSWMRVTVNNMRDTPSGSCQAYWPRVPFWGQGVYLDLLDSSVAGSCSSVLTNAEQLIGASATLEVHVERNSWGAYVDYGTRIDSVRLSTVTGGQYSRPRAPMVVTLGDGPSDNSSFTIFGQASMPRNDLNVRWNGPVPVDAAGEPSAIGGGNMILSGLGSYVAPGAEAGVICCSPTKPAERIVDLTATVPDPVGGTKVVGTARVVISDVGGPGAGLTIEEWSIT